MPQAQLRIDPGSAPQIMSTPPTPIEKARRRTHDTGFPEPFNDGKNTPTTINIT